MSYKKWIWQVLLFTCIMLTIVALVLYSVDPFCYYKLSDKPMISSSEFCAPGIIKNGGYDTYLIGSSMALNYSHELINNQLGGNAIRIVQNGLNLNEICSLVHYINSNQTTKTIVISLDIKSFAYENVRESRLPEYLLNNDLCDDYKYLFNYEAWIKYIPADIMIQLTNSLGITAYDDMRTSYEQLGRDTNLSPYNVESTIKEFNSITSKENSLTEKDIETINEHVKYLFATLDADNHPHTKYILLFPPYSALYWKIFDLNNQLDDMLNIRRQIVNNCMLHENISLLDFQACDFITDLSLYKDTMHYNYTINDYMTEYLTKPNYKSDTIVVESNNNRILQLMDECYKKYIK